MAEGPASTQSVERVRAEVDHRRELLTKNLSGYLEAAPALLARYQEHYDTVKSMNPKAREVKPKVASVRSVLSASSAPGSVEPYTPLLERKDSNVQRTAQRPPSPHDRAADTSEDAQRRQLAPPPEDPHLVEQFRALTKETYELRTVLCGVDDWLTLQEPAVKRQQDAEFSVALDIQRTVRKEVLFDVKSVGDMYEYESNFLSKLASNCSEYYNHPYAAPYWWAAIVELQRKSWDDLERCWQQMMRVVLMSVKELANNHAQLSKPLDGNCSAAAFM
eukprot:TRINITY_DN3372_c0_g1_i1.p2 TRINITY_DN3372_c0_g1~~TRINITY_DN3372_c0_g1_i1.p2  ORF type:complete len:301 (+),score=82.87 TRINITY_DN3372_c0_g1_i1:77-904(+)